jgi:hypothetical protein
LVENFVISAFLSLVLLIQILQTVPSLAIDGRENAPRGKKGEKGFLFAS